MIENATTRVKLNKRVFHCGLYIPEGTEGEVLTYELDDELLGKVRNITVKFDGMAGKLCRCDNDETKASLSIWRSWVDIVN